MYKLKNHIAPDHLAQTFNTTHSTYNEKILLTTMLTIKILFTINSLEKEKKLFIQNAIYNS